MLCWALHFFFPQCHSPGWGGTRWKGRAASGPQVALGPDSRDRSHIPATELPSAGTHPAQILAMRPNTRKTRQRRGVGWGGVGDMCTRTACVYTSPYPYVAYARIRILTATFSAQCSGNTLAGSQDGSGYVQQTASYVHHRKANSRR